MLLPLIPTSEVQRVHVALDEGLGPLPVAREALKSVANAQDLGAHVCVGGGNVGRFSEGSLAHWLLCLLRAGRFAKKGLFRRTCPSGTP
jgi:hypothetical protein